MQMQTTIRLMRCNRGWRWLVLWDSIDEIWAGVAGGCSCGSIHTKHCGYHSDIHEFDDMLINIHVEFHKSCLLDIVEMLHKLVVALEMTSWTLKNSTYKSYCYEVCLLAYYPIRMSVVEKHHRMSIRIMFWHSMNKMQKLYTSSIRCTRCIQTFIISRRLLWQSLMMPTRICMMLIWPRHACMKNKNNSNSHDMQNKV